jgi:hypothetical protein
VRSDGATLGLPPEGDSGTGAHEAEEGNEKTESESGAACSRRSVFGHHPNQLPAETCASESPTENTKERSGLLSSENIGSPLMFYPNMFAIVDSVQKFTCDIFGNVITISINQALESIHPVDKDHFHHFD